MATITTTPTSGQTKRVRFRRTRSALTGLAAICLLAVLLLGVPFALAWFVGNPLPTSMPDWNNVVDVIGGRRGVDTKVVVNVVAVIVWLTWIQIAMATLSELWYLAVGRAAETVAALAPIQIGVGKLVSAAAVTFTSLTRTALAGAEPPLEAVAAYVADPVDPTATKAEPATVAGIPAGEYVTRPGDTWWGIAEARTGDGTNWQKIRDANADRRMPDGTTISAATKIVRPGWQILVPDKPSETEADDTGQPPVEPPDTIVVKTGDNQWELAKVDIEAHLGREATCEEVTKHWFDYREANEENLLAPFDDNRIYPGQELTQPDPDPTYFAELAEQTKPAAAGPEPTDPVDLEPSDDNPDQSDFVEPMAPPAGSGAVPTPSPTTTPPPVTVPVAPLPQAVPEAAGQLGNQPVPASTTTTTVAPAAVETTVSTTPDGDGLPVRQIAIVAGLGALAAGVLFGLRRIRHLADRRRPPRQMTAPPPPGPTEQALADQVDFDELGGLDIALRALGRLINNNSAPVPDVIGATYGHDHYTILIDDKPVPTAPLPFVTDHDRSSWTLPYTEVDGLTDIAFHAASPLPCLVTVGTTPTGRTLLLDLERCRVVQVSGHPAHDRLATLSTITTELATSLLADHTSIQTAGLDRVHIADWSTVASDSELRDPDDYRRHVETITNIGQTPMESRIGDLGGDAFDPLVIVHHTTGPEPALKDMVDLADACHGGITLITDNDDLPHNGWEFSVDGDQLHIDKLDITVTRRNLTADESAAISDLVDHARAAEYVPIPADHPGYVNSVFDEHIAPEHIDPEPVDAPPAAEPAASETSLDREEPGNEPADTGTSDEDDDSDVVIDLTGPATAVPEPAGVDVSVLGPVKLNIEKTWDRARVPELVAYLALHPDGATSGTLHDKLFGETKPYTAATITKIASSARRALGNDNEGLARLPKADTDSLGRYRTHDVSTDLDRFHAHLAAARTADTQTAVEHLTQALVMVTGRPFSTRTEWRWSRELTEHAVLAIEEAATTVAEFHLAKVVEATDSGNDHLRIVHARQALWATKQGALTETQNEHLHRLRAEASLALGDAAEILSTFHALSDSLDAGSHPEDRDIDLDDHPELNDAYQRLRKASA